MDPISRIRQVDIKKGRVKLQKLRRRIDGIKLELSRQEDIFARQFRELDFGSTVPCTGKLYASFHVKKKVLTDYCEQRKIVAELDPVFAFYQDLEEVAITVGTKMDIPIMHDSDRIDFVKDISAARLMRDKQTKDFVAVKYIERGDTVVS